MPDETKPVETKPNYRTIEGLKEFPGWNMLTDKQKVFVEHYITSGGKRVESARKAFDTKATKNAEGIASRCLRKVHVRDCLEAYYGRPRSYSASLSKSELTDILADRIRDPKIPLNSLSALTDKIMQLNRWSRSAAKPERTRVVEEPPDEEPLPPREQQDIDDLIRDLEKDDR